MPLIDSHIHLDFEAFDHDRDAVVARANRAGVHGFVVPSVSERRWPLVERVCESVTNCHAGYGLHPCYLDSHGENTLERLEHWLDLHEAVAVGECGIDLHRNASETEARQIALFDAQIQIANRERLPLIIHARKSVDRVHQRLRLHAQVGGVVHSYSGSWQQACKLLDSGFHLGLGGALTHARAQKLQSIVRRLPEDSWVLETDAPDQSGAAHRGERNEPAFLPGVAACVAELRSVPVEEIIYQSRCNTETLFQLGN